MEMVRFSHRLNSWQYFSPARRVWVPCSTSFARRMCSGRGAATVRLD